MRKMNITQTRNRLLDLADEIEKKPRTVIEVQKHGRPVMTLISPEFYDSLVETLEILSDEDLMMRLKKAVKEISEGKGIPLEVSKRRLGLK
jgi:antitoxin YefM